MLNDSFNMYTSIVCFPINKNIYCLYINYCGICNKYITSCEASHPVTHHIKQHESNCFPADN